MQRTIQLWNPGVIETPGWTYQVLTTGVFAKAPGQDGTMEVMEVISWTPEDIVKEIERLTRTYKAISLFLQHGAVMASYDDEK